MVSTEYLDYAATQMVHVALKCGQIGLVAGESGLQWHGSTASLGSGGLPLKAFYPKSACQSGGLLVIHVQGVHWLHYIEFPPLPTSRAMVVFGSTTEYITHEDDICAGRPQATCL